MKFFAAEPPAGLDTSPLSDYWYQSMAVGSATGIAVNEEKALQVSAFFAGVRLISETVGMVPIFMYRRLGGSAKQKENRHPLHDLLHYQPNPWQTAIQWKQMMTAHAILRGNGYSQIIGGRRGAVDRLVPMNPTRMKIEFRENGDLEYVYKSKQGQEVVFPQEEIFHITGFGDGVEGFSVVQFARESLGLALAEEEHGARFFSNGAAPVGAFTHPGEMGEEEQQRFVKTLKRTHTGVKNHHSILVLEEGMEWQQLGMSMQDSQFLDSRKFQVNDIARWLGLPPHVLADLEKSSFNNIEEMARELVVFKLMPWWVRWEQVIRRDLIMRPETYFAEFTVDMLLRGDVAKRFESYKVGIEHGIYNPNEVRELENLNPRKGGERYWMPLNFGATDGSGSIEPAQEPATAQVVAVEPKALPAETVSTKARVIVYAAAERLVRKEAAAVKKWGPRQEGKPREVWSNWLDGWYGKHEAALVEGLGLEYGKARDYCAKQKQEALGGWSAASAWIPDRIDQLVNLALGGEEG
jgi:HK97 family phage portal protein